MRKPRRVSRRKCHVAPCILEIWVPHGSSWQGVLLCRQGAKIEAMAEDPREWHLLSSSGRVWRLGDLEWRPGNRGWGVPTAPWFCMTRWVPFSERTLGESRLGCECRSGLRSVGGCLASSVTLAPGAHYAWRCIGSCGHVDERQKRGFTRPKGGLWATGICRAGPEKEELGGVAEKSSKENPKVLTRDEGGGDLGPMGHFWVHSGEMIRSQPTQGPGHALRVP